MSRGESRHSELPRDVEKALGKARWLEAATIGWLCVTIVVVMLVMGSSQAMKAAWIEDALSFLPPVAFLVTVHLAGRKADDDHRYGHHRVIGAGHLVAAVALLGMGVFLIVDSSMTLIQGEHPTIGTMRLFGHTVWQGWLMIAAMIVTSIPTVVLGRMKLPVSKKLHDKILYADADMNKADWQTAAGAIAGIIGIGFGLWWADSVVAIAIAVSVVKDGWSNLTAALGGLLDHQARTHDDKAELGLVHDVESTAVSTDWVADAWVRMRDLGHVMHTEVFVIPTGEVPHTQVQALAHQLRALDWKLQDTQVIVVDAFPHAEPER